MGAYDNPVAFLGCRVPSCYRKHYGNDMCHTHYLQARRGKPLVEMGLTTAQLFWLRVKRGTARECWPFTGPRGTGGYGRFSSGGKYTLAHRFSYQLTHGRVPDGLLVCHRCDNPPCVNPAHLYAGTHADNAHDVQARGPTTSNACQCPRCQTREHDEEMRKALERVVKFATTPPTLR